MSKQGWLYVIVLAFIGVLIAYLNFPGDSSGNDNNGNVSSTVTGSLKKSNQLDSSSTPPKRDNESLNESDTDKTPTSSADLIIGESQPVLGQNLSIREIRSSEGTEQEHPQDIEFVFRKGILPKRLFEHTHYIIANYDQLQKNDVGSGAVTIRFYYEVVARDSNGDGVLSLLDQREVGVSFPDGSYYTSLVKGVDEVVAYEFLPVDIALRLTLRFGNKIVIQTYSLENNLLLSEE